MKKNKTVLVCILYILFLIVVKLFNFSVPFYSLNKFHNGINFIPLTTTLEYVNNFNNYNPSIILKVFLSLFIFVPISIYLGTQKRDKFTPYLLAITVLSFSILVRLFGIGYFDIDIIILRIIISYGTYFLTTKLNAFKKEA